MKTNKKNALELLDAILEKQGISRIQFAKAINIDPYELKKLVAAWNSKQTPEREKIFRGYIAKAHGLKIDKKELTLETRETIKAAIRQQYGTIKEFCDKTGMNRNSLNNVFTGQRVRTDGPIMKTLLTTLNIKP
jgi:predicted transcriptional regulator